MEKKRRNTILVQGSILAAASLISRIIGLIYRIPLTHIIGKTGNDYYGTAYTVYNIILIISSYSLPLAVSKVVSSRMAVKEYRNVRKVFLSSLAFALISGSAGMIIVLVFADVFTSWLRTPMASPALRILAPVILIVAIVGVLRGFFQGLNTMLPSAISQIIEQIVNAVVSVVAAYFLFKYGLRAGAVLGQQKKYAASFGAAGGTLGTAAGAFSAFLFMLFMILIYKKVFNKKIRRDKTIHEETYGELFKILIFTIIPVLMSTAVYNLFSISEMFIFKNVANIQGYNAHKISVWWGVYSGEVSVLKNIPVSIAGSLAASSVPAIASSFRKGNMNDVKSEIRSATRFISLISFPCTVGLIVLAKPILAMLFHDTDLTSAWMLIIGSISIPFFCTSTLTNGLLQGINRMTEPVKNAVITLVCHAVFLLFTLLVFNLNIYAVLISLTFYGIVMSLLNRLSLQRYSRTRLDIMKTYILPLIASLIMGIFVYLIYVFLHLLISSVVIPTCIAIIGGIFIYFVAIIKIKCVTKEEFYHFPKGEKLVSLGEKLHLF